MSWVRISSDLWRTERWRSLSAGARALFVDLLGVCGDRDSDGVLDRSGLALAAVDLAPGEASHLADELAAAGFIEQAGTGWQIVGPFDYLRPRAEIEAERQQRAEAAALGGAVRGRTGARGPDGKYVKPPAPAENPAERVPKRVERVVQPLVQPLASPVSVSVNEESTSRGKGTLSESEGTTEPNPNAESQIAADLHPRVRARPLTAREREAWAGFPHEWDAFKAAWLAKGFRLPPFGDVEDPKGQRAMLWEVLDARPTDLVRWIRASRATTPFDVIGDVLRKWHPIQDQAREADQAPRRARVDQPTPLGDILAKLVVPTVGGADPVPRMSAPDDQQPTSPVDHFAAIKAAQSAARKAAREARLLDPHPAYTPAPTVVPGISDAVAISREAL
jgi:hypothetical protein